MERVNRRQAFVSIVVAVLAFLIAPAKRLLAWHDSYWHHDGDFASDGRHGKIYRRSEEQWHTLESSPHIVLCPLTFLPYRVYGKVVVHFTKIVYDDGETLPWPICVEPPNKDSKLTCLAPMEDVAYFHNKLFNPMKLPTKLD